MLPTFDPYAVRTFYRFIIYSRAGVNDQALRYAILLHKYAVARGYYWRVG